MIIKLNDKYLHLYTPFSPFRKFVLLTHVTINFLDHTYYRAVGHFLIKWTDLKQHTL